MSLLEPPRKPDQKGEAQIRRARLEDLAMMAGIEAWAIENTMSNFLLEPRGETDWRAAFEQAGNRHPWLVAVDSGVIGFAIAGVYRVRPAYAWTTEVSVYVHRDHHRRGVASRLYERLLDVLAAQGFHNALAVVVTPNRASEQLHARLGFRQRY